MSRERVSIDVDKIVRLYRSDVPAREIAKRLDVSEATVRNRLRDAGILRSPEEARELRKGKSVASGPSPGYVKKSYFRSRDTAIKEQSFFCSERGFVRPAECLDCYEADIFKQTKMTRQRCIEQHRLPKRSAEMGPNEELIWRILRSRSGPGMAITAGAISRSLSGRVAEVQVRQTIRTLIVDYGLPIASVTTNPGGFFIPTSEEQRNHYANSLRSRIRHIAIRLRAFETAVAHAILKQLELEFTDSERGDREVIQGGP